MTSDQLYSRALIAALMVMQPSALAAETPTIRLADYALGQPIEDARLVIPAGHTKADWLLRCAREPNPPPGLSLSAAERKAGVERCWPMLATPAGEVHTAFPLRRAVWASEELEFLRGKIVRIRIWRSYADGLQHGFSGEISLPEAAEIDRLADF